MGVTCVWVRLSAFGFRLFSAQHTKKYRLCHYSPRFVFCLVLLRKLLIFENEQQKKRRDGSRLFKIDNTSWKSSWCMKQILPKETKINHGWARITPERISSEWGLNEMQTECRSIQEKSNKITKASFISKRLSSKQ